MTNEELAKLDFPIATMKMLLSTTAMLRTVLQNQMTIIKALNVADQEQLVAEINHLLQENLSIIDSDLKQQVPETSYVQYPKN
jgi:two-component sensor histidine kinase